MDERDEQIQSIIRKHNKYTMPKYNMACEIVDLRVEINRLRELLAEIACSGVAFSDPRIDYLEVQISTATWNELEQFRPEQEASNESHDL